MAERRFPTGWFSLAAVGACLVVFAIVLVVSPIDHSTESDSCGSLWSPAYPDVALENGGGCGGWYTTFTRASVALMIIGLVLVTVGTWKAARSRPHPGAPES